MYLEPVRIKETKQLKGEYKMTLINIISYFLYMVAFVIFPTYTEFRVIHTQKNSITINATYLGNKEIFLRGIPMYQPKFKYEYHGKEYVALSGQCIGNQSEFIQNDPYTIYINVKYPYECALEKLVAELLIMHYPS